MNEEIKALLLSLRCAAEALARLNGGTMHYGEWTDDNSAPYAAFVEVIDAVLKGSE